MSGVSLREAARLTGKDPSTITRAVHAGRLPATTDADGTRRFDPAELARVFGPPVGGAAAESHASPSAARRTHEGAHVRRTHEVTRLKERIASLEQALAQAEAAHGRERALLEAQIAELQSQVAAWRDQAGQAMRLLAGEARDPPADGEPRSGLWGRLSGR